MEQQWIPRVPIEWICMAYLTSGAEFFDGTDTNLWVQTQTDVETNVLERGTVGTTLFMI